MRHQRESDRDGAAARALYILCEYKSSRFDDYLIDESCARDPDRRRKHCRRRVV